MLGLELLLLKPLVGLIAAGITVGAVTYAVIRYWDHIIGWFRDRAETITDEKVAFTIKEKMTSGDCAFVQGIFNKQTEVVEEVRHVSSREVDEELRKVHSQKTLAIYS